MSEMLGQPTLFGGDVTNFISSEGTRLSEAVFRLRNDPPQTEIFRIAGEELGELKRLAELHGINDDEFGALMDYSQRPLLVDADGELFIDSEAGQRTYMELGGPIFGEGQGADAIAYLKSQLASIS